MKFNATQIMVALSLTIVTDNKLDIMPLLNLAKLLLFAVWLWGHVKRFDSWLGEQAEKIVIGLRVMSVWSNAFQYGLTG